MPFIYISVFLIMKKEIAMAAVLNVPNVVFKTRVRDESIGGENPFRWHDITSADIFSGKKVIVVALPSAFTSTCSSTHLPCFSGVKILA